MKVWIPVEDVDENCGPLNAININTTQIIFKKINKSIFFKKRNRKIVEIHRIYTLYLWNGKWREWRKVLLQVVKNKRSSSLKKEEKMSIIVFNE